MQDWFNMWKSINPSYQQVKEKDSHDHINGCRKTFDKIEQVFMIKTVDQLEMGEGEFPSLIKNIHKILQLSHQVCGNLL